MNNHEYSWEILYHFTCGECKNWWSIATTENRYQWKQQTMTCPVCGYRTKIQSKDNDAGFPIIRHTKPGYPYVPPETAEDVVDNPETQETTAVSETRITSTVSEKQKATARSSAEDSDRDDFWAKSPKVYSDGRGGIYQYLEGGVD